MTELYARLAPRNSRRVLCHVKDCGKELALVYKTDEGERGLALERGWIKDKHGIWTPGAQAAWKTKHGREPAYRRKTRVFGPDGIHFVDAYPMLHAGLGMPAKIRCDRCGAVQWLDPDVLDIDDLLRRIRRT